MIRLVNVFGHLSFWGYTLMLIAVGISGIFIARWELEIIFSIPLDNMSSVAQATLLNQYRFLKSIELAFGLFCISYHREIFQPLIAQRVFLTGVAAGVIARFGSWWFDGQPNLVFLAFAALELITGALVWYAGRRT